MGLHNQCVMKWDLDPDLCDTRGQIRKELIGIQLVNGNLMCLSRNGCLLPVVAGDTQAEAEGYGQGCCRDFTYTE